MHIRRSWPGLSWAQGRCTRPPGLAREAYTPILGPGWAWQGSVYVHSSLRPIGHRLARPASLTARSSAERPAWRPAPRCPVTAPSTARETGGRTTSRAAARSPEFRRCLRRNGPDHLARGSSELRFRRMSQAKRPIPDNSETRVVRMSQAKRPGPPDFVEDVSALLSLGRS